MFIYLCYVLFIYLCLCLYIFIIIIPTNSFPSFCFFIVCCWVRKKGCAPHTDAVFQRKNCTVCFFCNTEQENAVENIKLWGKRWQICNLWIFLTHTTMPDKKRFFLGKIHKTQHRLNLILMWKLFAEYFIKYTEHIFTHIQLHILCMRHFKRKISGKIIIKGFKSWSQCFASAITFRKSIGNLIKNIILYFYVSQQLSTHQSWKCYSMISWNKKMNPQKPPTFSAKICHLMKHKLEFASTEKCQNNDKTPFLLNSFPLTKFLTITKQWVWLS